MEGIEELREDSGVEGFEVWDHRVHAPEHEEVQVAFVSLRVGGVIGMNKACYKMWGSPEALRLAFDPRRRRIGLKPADRSDSGAFVLSYPDQGVAISAKRFCGHYAIAIPQARRFTPKLLGEMLIIDL